MSGLRPSLAQIADQELVIRARHGDKAAFAIVFERHRPTAVALARRLLDRQDVEDVLQESAVQAMVCLHRLQDPARFGPWLCGVALNLARQQLRKESRPARPPLARFGPPLTEELIEESETAVRVRLAIATLPRGQREAVELFYLDGLSEREVAAEVGIARSAVKSRLHKARRTLSAQLETERRPVMAQLPLVDVEVVDVRREPAAAPGGMRTHVVVLRERGGYRSLPIFVGEPEGRALASTLTGLQTPRPMTYQMMANLVAGLGGSVPEVRVVRLAEETFIAEVVAEGPSGTKVVDARPSDAINLALLTGAALRVSADLLEERGPTYEQIDLDLDAYPDDVNAIGAELSASARSPWLARLTPEAAAVCDTAREEASERAHAAVGTGHILLGLLRHGTPDALMSLGLSVPEVERRLGAEAATPAPKPNPPLTPRSRQVLLRAEKRARGRDDPRATPDDILAALLDEGGGLAARILDDSAVDRTAVRAGLSDR